jgi:fatty acid desaturase
LLAGLLLSAALLAGLLLTTLLLLAGLLLTTLLLLARLLVWILIHFTFLSNIGLKRHFDQSRPWRVAMRDRCICSVHVHVQL